MSQSSLLTLVDEGNDQTVFLGLEIYSTCAMQKIVLKQLPEKLRVKEQSYDVDLSTDDDITTAHQGSMQDNAERVLKIKTSVKTLAAENTVPDGAQLKKET
ncbi:hypothetical protein NPIL_483581 [Nephila pilipes]|uniref:Uncharacterized protein n=1 Tax=Nephila pilipes TaxID=299642 RepID=A0A8X6QZY1_NEPPI|nr:hypothetical protein NPIL_483581 [Nephila pilipes]